MSQRLTIQRCWNHTGREAVAKCPECSRFYCRECIVEHDSIVICSACLARTTVAVEKPRRRVNLAPVLNVAAALLGLVVVWIVFFSAGRLLLQIPDKFHSGTMWQRTFSDAIDEGAEE